MTALEFGLDRGKFAEGVLQCGLGFRQRGVGGGGLDGMTQDDGFIIAHTSDILRGLGEGSSDNVVVGEGKGCLLAGGGGEVNVLLLSVGRAPALHLGLPRGAAGRAFAVDTGQSSCEAPGARPRAGGGWGGGGGVAGQERSTCTLGYPAGYPVFPSPSSRSPP